MLKTTTAIVSILGSVGAASSSSGRDAPAISEQEALARVRSSFSHYSSHHSAVMKIASSGTQQAQAVASSGQLKSSTPSNFVSGNWIMKTTAAAGTTTCSNTDTPAVTFIAKMGLCGQYSENSTATPHYSMWECEHDSVSGDITLTETRYSDSACTTDASAQPSWNLDDACNGGELVSCTVSNPLTTSVESSYADGLSTMMFTSSSDCMTNTSALISFGGIVGCLNNAYYDEDAISFYIMPDCSGSALFTFKYSQVFPFSANECISYVSFDDDGDDDYYYDDDDDDFTDMLGSREDTYLIFHYGKEDDNDDFCFHIDSKIDYKGVEYTYEELKAGKEPECSVPHSPSSRGVVISTSCDKAVRVTDTHLMATTRGFQLAYSLKAGDVLFGDHEGKELCTVQGVEKEKSTEQYFGLNCVHSEVLASGLRASTFGDFHTLPSWYMSYVGSVVGTDRAALLGEYVAEWYFQK